MLNCRVPTVENRAKMTADGLSDEMIEELREAFNLFDSGGDGLINASELHMVMQAIGRNMSEEEVKTEIKKIK